MENQLVFDENHNRYRFRRISSVTDNLNGRVDLGRGLVLKSINIVCESPTLDLDSKQKAVELDTYLSFKTNWEAPIDYSSHRHMIMGSSHKDTGERVRNYSIYEYDFKDGSRLVVNYCYVKQQS